MKRIHKSLPLGSISCVGLTSQNKVHGASGKVGIRGGGIEQKELD